MAVVQQVGARGDVAQVQVKGENDADWQSLTNTWGADWETPTSPGPPIDMRIVADDGSEVASFSALS